MKSFHLFLAFAVLIPDLALSQSGTTIEPGLASRKVSTQHALPEGFEPDPRWSPDQVVRFQLEALQNNDQPEKDAGIKIAFSFSSPANRASVGPLEHFTAIVRNPVYSPMLNHRLSRLEPVELEGDVAVQRVTLWDGDGRRAVYLFTLTRQTEGPYRGCWMTDAVVRLTTGPQAMV